MNKFSAKLIFKGGDLFAHGRLTDSALLCDSGEAALSITRTNICIASNSWA